jgi:hypothetical protein
MSLAVAILAVLGWMALDLGVWSPRPWSSWASAAISPRPWAKATSRRGEQG